jgi:hypothetical protein
MVVRDHVEDRVPAAHEAHQALDLVVAVVDAGQQRPLQLRRVAGGARIGFRALQQLGHRDARRARQQRVAARVVGGMQRQRERGLHRSERQALERAQVAHRGEHQVLVADAARGAEQLDRVEHVVEVVRGLAHAHEHHLVDRAPRARQRHLRHDLGAAELAREPALARLAEHAAHRAAHLGGHAQAVALAGCRQQHGLDGLPVGQRDQQARRAVGRRVLGLQAGERREFVAQRRQRVAQGLRQVMLDAAPAGGLRLGLDPAAQHVLLVRGVGAEGAVTCPPQGVPPEG